jgi:hypothetical protein
MPGVQFPFSTATEDERLAAIYNQIGNVPVDIFSPAAVFGFLLSRRQPKRALASAACSPPVALISTFAKVELRAQYIRI